MEPIKFGQKALLKLTGCLDKQVYKWNKEGLIKSFTADKHLGKNNKNFYSFQDVLVTSVAKIIQDMGVSPVKAINVKKALVFLRDNMPNVYELTKDELKDLLFFTDYENIFEFSSTKMFNLNGNFGFVINLGNLIEELFEKIEKIQSPHSMEIAVKSKKYNVYLTPDIEEGGYVVTCKEIPQIISQGESIDNSIENVKDAINLYIKYKECYL